MTTDRVYYCPGCEADALDDGYCQECGTDWCDVDDALKAADALRQALNAYQGKTNV